MIRAKYDSRKLTGRFAQHGDDSRNSSRTCANHILCANHLFPV